MKVLSVDPEAKRISLSIRALLEPEHKDTAEASATAESGEDALPVDIEAVGKQLEDEASKTEE